MTSLDNNKMTPKYSRSYLINAFSKVQDNSNWKNPINAIIRKESVDAVNEAILYFTGSKPTFTNRDDGYVNVTADGYYLTIGA